MNFFAELKRRNVYKVAVAYAVVAWLLIQAASILLPTFEAPAWVMKVVVLAVVLGFPIALILAWAFELTPQGIRRSEDVAPGQPHSPGAAWIYIAIIGAALAIALVFVGRYTARTSSEATIKVPEKSIAVLPFENLSEEKANAYFAEGVQDEILTKLSTIRDLKVISRTSTAKYQSKPENLRLVAEQLSIANVLEGSVQRAEGKVRVKRAANRCAEGHASLGKELRPRVQGCLRGPERDCSGYSGHLTHTAFLSGDQSSVCRSDRQRGSIRPVSQSRVRGTQSRESAHSGSSRSSSDFL
jgi:TolB-like protein